MSDYTALRAALAAGPTEGRWMHLPGDRFVYDRMEDGCRGNPVVGVDYTPPFFSQKSKNLDYIAAADPQTIAALLAELDDARRDAERLRKAAEPALRELKFYAGCYGKSKSSFAAVDDFDAAMKGKP